MQRLDAAAIDGLGIPRLLLMDHAGLAVARAVRALTSSSSTIVICCGTGFNGGDGLAAARHLAGWGYRLRILLAGRVAALREEPATFARILRRLGVRLHEVPDTAAAVPVTAWFAAADLIVDALLGLGARGAVREPMATLIGRINRSGKPVVAVDVPSGLDGDTGTVQGVAVQADVTVTMGLPKRGCTIGEGPAHTGTLIVDDITFPSQLLTSSTP